MTSSRPMSDPIALLKAHLRKEAKIHYTGRKTDANKLAHIKPLYVSFVLAHLDFFKDTYKYTLDHKRTEPGQKSKIFKPFRDVGLPVALRQLRAEADHVSVEQVEPTEYLYKRNQVLKNTNEPCILGVVGWEPVKKRVVNVSEEKAADALLEMTGMTGPAEASD